MNNINFINNNKKKHPLENSKWIYSSIVLTIITISTITFITIKQWKQIITLKKETKTKSDILANLNKITKEKNQLTKEQKRLKAQSRFINKLTTIPKKKFTLIEEIYRILPQNISLQNLSIIKTKIELSVVCPNEQTAILLVQKISDLPEVKSIHLASIQSYKNQLSFTIKGKIKK